MLNKFVPLFSRSGKTVATDKAAIVAVVWRMARNVETETSLK